jgi:hypothetical protein
MPRLVARILRVFSSLNPIQKRLICGPKRRLLGICCSLLDQSEAWESDMYARTSGPASADACGYSKVLLLGKIRQIAQNRQSCKVQNVFRVSEDMDEGSDAQ